MVACGTTGRGDTAYHARRGETQTTKLSPALKTFLARDGSSHRGARTTRVFSQARRLLPSARQREVHMYYGAGGILLLIVLILLLTGRL
jgi:hypothetical protein